MVYRNIVIILMSLFVFSVVIPFTVCAGGVTVYQTQKILKQLEYDPGPLDGIWGGKTREAIVHFQNDQGLKPTGQLDEETQSKLIVLIESKSTDVDKGNLIKWSELSDPFNVSTRTLQQKMTMQITGNRYIVDRSDGVDPLTCAPGTYGGRTIMGLRGKAPRVKPLLGYVENVIPDPMFYSVLGIGSSLTLPNVWIKIFGVQMQKGNILIITDGLLLHNVEIIK